MNKKFLVIEECSNPSTEYYVIPFLESFSNNLNFFVCQKPLKKIEENTIVIFVRYIESEWIDFIDRNERKIRKIIYFMDDDLFDLSAHRGLPLKYRYKIYSKAYKRKKWLIAKSALFLVSNEYLRKKYHFLNPVVIPPYPIFNNYKIYNNNSEMVSIFYFATSSHKKEAKWLFEVVKEIIEKHRNVVFEIIGDKETYKLYRPLERVVIIHSMKWSAYKNFLISKRRHIGLVPVSDMPFNRGRNYNKFFEITGCGAVGVYSEDSIYNKVIIDGKNGILLPNEKNKWIDAISELISNSELRLKLYNNAIESIESLRQEALKTYILLRKLMED